MFKKSVYLFHSLSVTLEISTKTRMTHFNIFVAVNATEIINIVGSIAKKEMF